MDIISTSRPMTFGVLVSTVAANVFAGVGSFVVTSIKAYNTRKALYKLTPRQLDDIGLTRADIVDVSSRAAFR